MLTEQEPNRPQPPVRRAPAPRRAPPSGGLTLTRLVLAVVVLLLLAYYVGNRRSAKPAPEEAAAAESAAESTSAARSPRSAGATVIEGEKSTTLKQVDEARMSLQEQGSVLRIEGGIGLNFAKDLGAALDANPSLQRIDITSGGGYAGPGLEAARMIRRRNLIVRVRSHCASMCVALWAAGTQRQMEPDAVIGLHDWDAQCDARPSPQREQCNYQVQFATDHDASYDSWLRDAGFNQRLLDLQSKTASKDIALLIAPQLWANGVDFSVVDQAGNRMSREQVQHYLAARGSHR